MAVCNLFSELLHDSGNFLMFSQYSEDITKGFSEGDKYKVIPSKFVALNIDYSNINIPTTGNLNVDIPNYFQNYYENGCAFGKNTFTEDWTPDKAKNLFWSAMYDGKFLVENNIQCINNINLQSYNIHSGMGYGEIYCYIPTTKKQEKYIIESKELKVFEENSANTLEGFPDISIKAYNKIYYYDEKVTYARSEDTNATNYNINTIVVLYSIAQKIDDTWSELYEDIPMGIYFTGKFNGTNISNPITKFVDNTTSTGTAYGLRICTRFTSTSQGKEINTDITTSTNAGEMNNVCQLMSAMSENLSKMFEITKSAIDGNQHYKDLLSIIKNNKSNVPYIKEINGKNYWFVNGKLALDTPILVEEKTTT
jgi:hypothetical protein